MLSFVVIFTHAFLMAAVILRVLLRRPARGVALAWLLLAVVLPYVGAIALFPDRRAPHPAQPGGAADAAAGRFPPDHRARTWPRTACSAGLPS